MYTTAIFYVVCGLLVIIYSHQWIIKINFPWFLFLYSEICLLNSFGYWILFRILRGANQLGGNMAPWPSLFLACRLKSWQLQFKGPLPVWRGYTKSDRPRIGFSMRSPHVFLCLSGLSVHSQDGERDRPSQHSSPTSPCTGFWRGLNATRASWNAGSPGLIPWQLQVKGPDRRGYKELSRESWSTAANLNVQY